jgi:hypothetical protein
MTKSEFTSTDSLTVTETEDGTFAMQWDPNDPRYSYLNEMTEDEVQEIVTNALRTFIAKCEEEESNV